ncbi:hypothetical protein DPMN_164636 [Dreissena polymorpha]|uniref:Uncharacterized protein n=1 Tax=Dreissena polymorpha TaxID=45954 RepID=A0A9D4IVL5_DREPO|nr:hypothetical protein DPMN_164636 [Dreissena polymorpha]
MDPVEYLKTEILLKREKIRLKTNFTKARKKVVSHLEGNACSATVNDACKQLDFAMDEVIKGLDSLSNMYMEGDELEKSKIVIAEMEKIELEYEITTEDACAYLNDLRSETASQVSKALSQDTVSKLYISKDRPVSHNSVRQNDKFPKYVA